MSEVQQPVLSHPYLAGAGGHSAGHRGAVLPWDLSLIAWPLKLLDFPWAVLRCWASTSLRESCPFPLGRFHLDLVEAVASQNVAGK